MNLMVGNAILFEYDFLMEMLKIYNTKKIVDIV